MKTDFLFFFFFCRPSTSWLVVYKYQERQEHSTGWSDKIVALEKTIWFHFRLMKTDFLFFFCRPSTSWPVVYKYQERQENSTGWSDKIVALEKTIWFHFRLMKTDFLFFFFFFCRPSTSWPVVYKYQERQEPSTGWSDKIVALEKTTWFYFRLMKTGFLFLLQTIYKLASCIQIPRVIGAFYHVWK